jgi:endoglucanase
MTTTRRLLLPCLLAALGACGEGSATLNDLAPLDVPSDNGTPDAPADPGTVLPVTDRLPAFPLATSGRWIVGADGRRFKLSGVNWQAHMSPTRIEALDKADVRQVAAALRRQGFTVVRLTWSNEGVERNLPLDPDGLAANPALVGKSYLEGLDAVVDALGAEGIVVIPNNHMSDAGPCCSETDDNGFWYNDRYPESAWIADWKTLVLRWKDRPWVAGADLRNELRFLIQWGGDYGTEYDWPSAAERCGNALLAVNPDLLIVVEGASYGKFLQGVKTRPILLDLPDRVVYGSHDYPWHHRLLGRTTNDWKNPGELYATLDEWWGYLLVEDQPWTAPVWLGEFGDNPVMFSETSQWDTFGLWFMVLHAYIALHDLDWSIWSMSWNGAEGLLDMATLEPGEPMYGSMLRTIVPARMGPGVGGNIVLPSR